jgi:hypothetical protein
MIECHNTKCKYHGTHYGYSTMVCKDKECRWIIIPPIPEPYEQMEIEYEYPEPNS